MSDIIPELRIAQVVRIQYSGSISIVTFNTGNFKFNLYGDGNTTQNLEEYIGKLVRLCIFHPANWTWSPI